MTERMWENAVAMGRRNQQLIVLAKHHCTRMEFAESGGRGMAEESTGLPINMRQVRCPVAHGGMASNLELIIPAFYREHCVGCEMRSPTGRVPNLATLVQEQDAAAAAAKAREAERVAGLHQDWVTRGESRRTLLSQVDELTATAISDIGLLDSEPGVERDRPAENEALGRLRALAERASHVFTTQLVTHAVELVVAGQATEMLLDPLRLVARRRSEFACHVVAAALAVLRVSPSGPAGRCVADLIEHVTAADIDDAVCRSLVVLAGAPVGDEFMRQRKANDPAGLIAIAGLAQARLVRILRDMLPGPTAATELLLPAGTAPREPGTSFTIGSAAGAVRVLSGTHPDLAAELVKPLVLQLSSDEFDDYDDEGLPEVERALAVLLVDGVGNVPDVIVPAGAHGSSELGERLLEVLGVAEDLVSANPHWRRSGDPTPTRERAAEVADLLFELAMGRLGGDWGEEALVKASDLIENLARERPDILLARLAAILGGVLSLISELDQINQTPVPSLEVVGGEWPIMQGLEAQSKRVMRSSAIMRLLSAVKAIAAAEPLPVVAALSDVLTDERDTERGSDLAYYLLETLGEIGHSHGDAPGVLQAILPVLHTYLVGVEVGPRARALDAWVLIGRRHQLPSSLVDLLPALSKDPYVAVARALLRASVVAKWPGDALPTLMFHAATMLNQFRDGSNGNALKEAISAALEIAARIGDDTLHQAVERTALEAADTLGPYDLKDVLQRSWSKRAAESSQMSRLRFKQAIDPNINDRFNRRNDQPELVKLLDCGPGLLSLSTEDLVNAAVGLGPDQPLAAVEFAEVTWRAGRLEDAVAVMEALVAATPDQPAYTLHKLLFDVLAAAARADAAAATGADWAGHARQADAAAAELAKRARDEGQIKHVTDSVVASMGLRRLLKDASLVDAGRPSDALRQRADELVAAGEELAKASTNATATGRYLRAVVAFCEVAAHLLRGEAAAFDADSGQLAAHRVAAERRCDLIMSELTDALGPDDPIGGPLLHVLEQARAHPAGGSTDKLFEQWAALPLPITVVVGARRSRNSSVVTESPDNSHRPEDPPVAVVLASLDGQLITGPAVLRHHRVYELSVRVQTGEWPVWASRLEGELLSHLTAAEITTPTFSWSPTDHIGDGETYEQSGSVVLRFSVAAGAAVPPLLIRLTWHGEDAGARKSQSLNVAGHRQLRLRPYDESRDRATDYPVFDERLLKMYDRFARSGFDEDQLQAFCRLFTSVCRVGLAITWERKYRRGTRVTERAFHDDIHERLMGDPDLGGRVERGSPLALGYLDVRHDGITAELKVERQTPVTKERAPKYMGQPTQYAAADGARLSILAILDMSPKQMPIGTPENYLFELVPKLHGMDNPEAPSIVAVLVVNGNMPTPSSWSRKKTPVQGVVSDDTPAPDRER